MHADHMFAHHNPMLGKEEFQKQNVATRNETSFGRAWQKEAWWFWFLSTKKKEEVYENSYFLEQQK